MEEIMKMMETGGEVITNGHWINYSTITISTELSYLKMTWKLLPIFLTISKLLQHYLTRISPLWLYLHGMTMDREFVHDSYALYRSDFFPGLGWMLTKSTWDELSPKWPKGSSMGQFFKKYLEPIKLNDVQVDWKSVDLTYLMEEKYLKHFASSVAKAKPIHGSDVVLKASNIEGDVRIQYKDQPEFERIAQQFGVFNEWKDGVPRTAYKGVVVFRHQTARRVFLTGPDSLRQLGISDV